MAKINTGPLIADATGAIGPLVFRRTRFGQVVQARPKMPPIKNSTVLANNSLFADAQNLWSRLPPTISSQMARLPYSEPVSLNGQFVRQQLHLLRSEPTAPVLPYLAHARPLIGAQSATATTWNLAVGKTSDFRSGNTVQTQAQALEPRPSMRRTGTVGLPPDWTSLAFLKSQVTPPFTVVLWFAEPFWIYGAPDITTEFSGLYLYTYT
jgi:hypothetical protein